MRNCIVLGSGRSGTSMAAGCLHGAGYFMGENLMPPNEQNPKGYFESYDIEAINEELLSQVCRQRPSGWAGRRLFAHRPRRPQRWLANVPLEVNFSVGPQLEARMRAQVQRVPYSFKDPRFCYTLPAWRGLLDDPVYLVVFREPGRTVNSILNTLAREPYLRDLRINAAGVMRVWIAQYRHILEKHSREGEWIFLHYDQIIDGSGVARVETASGARLDLAFPERALRRSPDDTHTCSEARKIYQTLCERAGY